MIYADTGFLIALRIPGEEFHRGATRFYEARQDEIWLWSPWHRVEVFNSIRQLVRHPERKRRLLLSEAKALIFRLEQDVRADYFTHKEADWRDVLRTANEVSIAHACEMPCRAADLLHVAYAKELSAECFVGYDQDQLSLAAAAGMEAQRPV